jgi:hypothetical protein
VYGLFGTSLFNLPGTMYPSAQTRRGKAVHA